MDLATKIITIAIETGLVAVLFVWLLFYVLRDSSKREKKYQSIIESMNENMKIVEDIHEDITEIKTEIKTITKGEKRNGRVSKKTC